MDERAWGIGIWPEALSVDRCCSRFLFVCYLLEVFIFEQNLSPFWPILLILFFLTQAGRVWALFSLGKYWNTKIIVLPGAEVVRRGPYRFIKHPNYAIVAAEFLVIPLMFQAYITAAVFTLLNIMVLYVRIPAEEKALKELTEYEEAFYDYGLTLMKILKKFDNFKFPIENDYRS